MSLFKMADSTATEVYWFGDESEEGNRDWIRVRSSLSKAESNQVLKTVPREERDIEGGLAFVERFFEKVIVAWSLKDEHENEVAPTVENFRAMDAAGARLIEEQVMKHFNKVLGREVEKLEGESSS